MTAYNREAIESRFWSDAAYSRFYEMSSAERDLTSAAAGAGAKRAGTAMKAVSPTRQRWSRAVTGPSALGERLSRSQLEAFQCAFAEWGGNEGIRCSDFRPFLHQLGVELLPEQARSLWHDSLADAGKEGSDRLVYADALVAYREVLATPVRFHCEAGSAPPGKKLGHSSGAREIEEEAAERRRLLGAGRPGRRPGKHGGMGLSVDDARELLLSEDLPVKSVEEFLCRFADEGVVPQATLFDYLTMVSDVSEPAGFSDSLCGLNGTAPSVTRATAVSK